MTHHAFLYRSAHKEAAGIPKEYLSPQSDVVHVDLDVLTIVDVRMLINEASVRPLVGSHRVFVVTTRDILREAQHALLKLLEEPPATALFYFIVPQTALLLPTVLSRFHEVQAVGGVEPVSEVWTSFVQMNTAQRLTYVAHIAKEKDLGAIEQVVAGFERQAQQQRHSERMAAVVLVRRHMRSKGASLKMLLEHLVVTPQ